MKTVIVLLLIFLGIGLFARKFNAAIRLLLITVIVGMLLFLNLN